MKNTKHKPLEGFDLYTYNHQENKKAEREAQLTTALAIFLLGAWLFALIYQMNQFAHWLDQVFFI